MSYATDEQLKLAEELGYENDRSTTWGDKFSNGKRLVWPIRSGWQTADYISAGNSERSVNHKRFEHLEDALRRPLKV